MSQIAPVSQRVEDQEIGTRVSLAILWFEDLITRAEASNNERIDRGEAIRSRFNTKWDGTSFNSQLCGSV
jgi:hypothetical protein